MGNRIYLQNPSGLGQALQERVMALDADTGKVVWEYKFNVFQSDVPPHRVGWASPAADPETGNIYAMGVGATVVALTKDGKPIWGAFDAQGIFEELKGELHLRPCKIGFAAFYQSLGRVGLTEDHPDEKPVVVSGTRVREQLQKGERPDPRIMRPEIADVLIEAYRGA